MWTSLVLSLVSASTSVEPVRLEIPPGLSGRVHGLVDHIQRLQAEGELGSARELAGLLPTGQVQVTADFDGVPPEHMSAYRAAIELAMTNWSSAHSLLSAEWAPEGVTPHVLVTFVESLGDEENPRSAVFFEAMAPGEPAYEAVIALSRDGGPLRDVDLTNEVQFAIGRALGLEERPLIGSAVSRDESRARAVRRLIPGDVNQAIQATQVRQIVLEALDEGAPLPRVGAQAFVNRPQLPLNLRQVEPVIFTMEIVNRGEGTLLYEVIADCACFTLDYNGRVNPGQTSLVRIGLDTTIVPGDFRKALYVYTNDPDRSLEIIEFVDFVQPAFEFTRSWSGSALTLGPDQREVTLGLLLDPDINIREIASNNADSPASWRELERPAEPPSGWRRVIPRSYEITVRLPQREFFGRLPLGFAVETDHGRLDLIRWSFQVQRGIAVLPTAVFLGQMGVDPIRGTAQIVRPERPFGIREVRSDSPFIIAEVRELEFETGYEVMVEYLGGAPLGTFEASVTVVTDDPDEPEVVVPIRGVVR